MLPLVATAYTGPLKPGLVAGASDTAAPAGAEAATKIEAATASADKAVNRTFVLRVSTIGTLPPHFSP